MQSKNREIINPEGIHAPVGNSHLVCPKGEKHFYLSGQVPMDKDLNLVGKDDLATQTDMVYRNIEQALNEVGAMWDHIVKMTVYTTMPHEYEIIGSIAKKYYGNTLPPALTIVGVNGLALPEFLIEIEAIIVI